MPKKALITGITGQDGSYLTELLLEKGYEVHGLIRRASTFNTERLDPVYQDSHNSSAHLFLHYGDLADAVSTYKIIDGLQPDEVYHLGAQSHVRVSFDVPEYTGDVTGTSAPTRILEAIRETAPKARVLTRPARAARCTGWCRHVPQTRGHAVSIRAVPYGCSEGLRLSG